MIRALVLCCAGLAALSGAESGVDWAPALDETAKRRAEAAADALVDELGWQPPTVAAEHVTAVAEVERLAETAKAHLAAGRVDRAGAAFVDARKRLAAVPADARAALRVRVAAIEASLLELARQLLAIDALAVPESAPAVPEPAPAVPEPAPEPPADGASPVDL